MKPLIFFTLAFVGCGPIQKKASPSPVKTTVQAPAADSSANEAQPPSKVKIKPMQSTGVAKVEVKPKGSGDPNFLKGLPKWEDINPPTDMPNPTAGLGLVLETNTCFKEFFGDRTVHPHVRKYGGRILAPQEKAMGRMVICPEDRKAKVLAELKKAGVI